jgi:hypothetical protein
MIKVKVEKEIGSSPERPKVRKVRKKKLAIGVQGL